MSDDKLSGLGPTGWDSDREPQTPLEKALTTLARHSFWYAIGAGTILGIYLLSGTIITLFGLVTLPYPLFSVDNDPMFALLASCIAIALMFMNVSLVFLALVAGRDEIRTAYTVLLHSLSIGFCAGVLRYTLPTSIEALHAIAPL